MRFLSSIFPYDFKHTLFHRNDQVINYHLKILRHYFTMTTSCSVVDKNCLPLAQVFGVNTGKKISQSSNLDFELAMTKHFFSFLKHFSIDLDKFKESLPF